jgi:hypothetical protein
MKSYVCITAGEWRNLCSMGRIRLHQTRAISCTEKLSAENYDLLFSLAADRFLLGETSDFLITEFNFLRTEIEGTQPPGHESGVRWLFLQDVIRFFPLRADDSWAFEADAHKAQITLSEASFERQWNEWYKDQLVNQACINGLTLIRALEFGNTSNKIEAVPASWAALATRIIKPNFDVEDASDFSTKFIRCRDRLFDLVREDLDCGAFFVSCPIEWINLQSENHIFDTDADLAEQAQLLHEKYLNVAFESSLANLEDIKEFETLLIAKAPDAFPGSWHPSMISLYVRYVHKIQFGTSPPDEIVAAVRAIDTLGDRRAAELLAFLFGVALGSNKAHSLERLLHPKRFEAVSVTAPALTQPVPAIQTVPATVDSDLDQPQR